MSDCGLRGSLDRGLAVLTRLRELNLCDNLLEDLHSGGLLLRLQRLEVVDLRNNSPLWEAGGFGFGKRQKRLQKNAHTAAQLQAQGVVLLLDAAARSPACPCCN